MRSPGGESIELEPRSELVQMPFTKLLPGPFGFLRRDGFLFNASEATALRAALEGFERARALGWIIETVDRHVDRVRSINGHREAPEPVKDQESAHADTPRRQPSIAPNMARGSPPGHRVGVRRGARTSRRGSVVPV
jgi:hypothetical protein